MDDPSRIAASLSDERRRHLCGCRPFFAEVLDGLAAIRLIRADWFAIDEDRWLTPLGRAVVETLEVQRG